jgi:hypothetical protein
MKVQVTPLLMRQGMVRIAIEQLGKEPLMVEVEPEREFDDFGRSISAQVIGDGYSRAADTLDERQAKRLIRAAYGGDAKTLDDADALRAKQARPFAHLNEGRGAVAHSHLGQEPLPQRMMPAAAELDTPAVAAARASSVELAPLSHVEAAKTIKAMIGEDWVPADHFIWLQQRYPDGVSPDHIETIVEELRSPHGGTPLQLLKGGK